MSERAEAVDHQSPLHGVVVGVTAERRADVQVGLLEQRGAQVVRGPVLRTVDLSEDPALLGATRATIADPPDVLVVQTGQGLTWWFEAADAAGMGVDLRRALRSTRVLTRGAKATSAARRLALDVDWQAPGEVIDQVIGHVAGLDGVARLVVQLDGADDADVLAALASAIGDGAVVAVPVYRWTLPTNPGPALDLVRRVVGGSVDAVTFTASPAVDNLARLAATIGLADALDGAFAGPARAVCVGPVCSATARRRGWRDVIEPERPRLVAMVDALAARWAPSGAAG